MGRAASSPVHTVPPSRKRASTSRNQGTDKVLQRSVAHVVMVLESVYEQDFRDCSFGFRPGRLGSSGAHAASRHGSRRW